MKAERPSIGKPTLRPSDLGDPAAAVLTIGAVDFRQSNFVSERSGKRETKCVLGFTGDERVNGKELWVNKTGTTALIDHFGDETDVWIGKLVPLVRAVVNQKVVFQVAVGAPPLDWDGVLAEFKRRSGKGKKA